MSELSTFDFESNAVRTITIEGETWFVGKDVCNCLEISKHHQALDRLSDDELSTYTIGTQTQRREMKVVSEPGLYRLIFTSRTEAAERFKKWLAHEVLPAIRKHGRFELTTPDSAPRTDLVARGLLDDGRLALNIVREARSLFGKSAAKRVWPQLGLPEIREGGDDLDIEDDPDGVESFARACIVRQLNSRSLVSDIYKAYCDWCKEQHRRSISQRWFSRQMTEMGIADKGRMMVGDSKVSIFRDIVLKDTRSNSASDSANKEDSDNE